ncbi:MAG TPA: hypothetical protein VNA20_12085 [Frankiaceae bacterium]|nr:hypothetical protein [Frankiaceae bacterium]
MRLLDAPRVPVEVVARRRLPGHVVWRLPGGRWTVERGPELLVVDARLDVLAAFALGDARDWRGIHAVSPDLAVAVLSLPDRVRAVDRRNRALWEFPHPPWGDNSGSAGIAADGVVWVTAPVLPPPRGAHAPEWWLTLDLGTGRLLGESPTATDAAGSEHLIHPDGRRVGLSVGEGQDAARIFWGEYDGTRATVRQAAGDDRVLIDISPDGRHYLTTPHGTNPGIALHDMETDELVARLDGWSLFGDNDFGFHAGFLDDELVLACSEEEDHLVLLDARTLALRAVADLPRGMAAYPPITGGDGSWLCHDWRTGDHLALRLADG